MATLFMLCGLPGSGKTSLAKRLEAHGAEVSTMTPDQLKIYVQQEQVKWKKVVQAAKLTAD